MTVGLAILLGLVQGLTEFLPVSSSGHLVLVQTFFGGSNPEADYMLFDVLLHFGTLVSVCIAFWGDIRELFVEFFRLGARRLPAPEPPLPPVHRNGTDYDSPDVPGAAGQG